MSRATTYSGSGKPHQYTQKHMKAIFESAAGPDGKLSADDAKGVEKFLRASGKDLKHISYHEAKYLIEKWQTQAARFLPSITSYDDISKGFNKFSADMKASSDNSAQFEEYLVKLAVFSNRVRKGSNSLGSGTKAMISKKTNDLMFKAKDLAPMFKVALGKMCLQLLTGTVAKSKGDIKITYNNFMNDHFKGSRFYKQVD